MRVLVVVPAFNEQGTIKKVLLDIFAHVPQHDLLVIDDGSTDRTASIAENSGASLLRHGKNRGKGAAIESGLEYARRSNCGWAIMMDADGQHSAESLPLFLSEIALNRADFIIGNRMNDREGMPAHRILSNGVTSIILSLLAGGRLHDTQCGFRAVRLSKLKRRPFRSRGFQVESEMILRMGRAKARFREIEVPSIYGKESSSMVPFLDTMRFLRLIVRSLFW